MAKRNSPKRNYVWVEEPYIEEVEEVRKETPKEEELPIILEDDYVNKIPLQLQRDITLNCYGPVTQTLYQFEGAGSIVYVYEEDVEPMLQKRGGRGCCSSTPPISYFKRVI